jgi:hypothetical protein
MSTAHPIVDRKDEKALLDDLMAGLDASIFDFVPSSPAVSQKAGGHRRSSQSSPLKSRPNDKMFGLDSMGIKEKAERKVKKEALSPIKQRASPVKRKKPDLPYPNRSPVTVKLEQIDIPPPPVIDLDIKEEEHAGLKDEVEDFDDELFAFDLGEVDFDALDGDVSARTETKASHETSESATALMVRSDIPSHTRQFRDRRMGIALRLGFEAKSRQSLRDFFSQTAVYRLWNI